MFHSFHLRRVSFVVHHRCALARQLRALVCVLLLVLLFSYSQAQNSAPATEGLSIQKIDPPNWYAAMPKPMLLVRGEGFIGATFHLSDPAIHIETRDVSANGHWAQLWLSASPAQPETVTLTVTRDNLHAEQPYTFAARRAASDGLAGFSSADTMYLIMTDRFADGDLTNDGPHAHSTASSAEALAERDRPRGWHGGDLRGITAHLDYLQQLGVTTIWPTPVYQNLGPDSYHGYHCTDYYAVDPHYGSMADLQTLAGSLHARGMKLVLDTVPNHVGPLHPWVTDEPMPDWFHGTLAHHIATQYDFNWLVDPHSLPRDRDSVLDGWFVNELPDMNTENPAVAQYLRQNAAWWLEQTGADGLRIDTFAYVNRQFWHDYDESLHALFPHVTEVGEVLDGDPRITSFFAGGRSNTAGDGTVDTGLYTPFDFPVFYSLVAALTGRKPMSAITDTLREDAMYPHPERLVTLLGNHDQPRFLSQPDATPARLRLAYGLLATLRGTPQLYYGDEVVMTGGDDPADRKDFPGGFPGDTANAFSAAGRSAEQQEMHDWVAALFTLRSRHPALLGGYQQDLSSDATTFVFLRSQGQPTGCAAQPAGERVLVVLNVDKSAKDVPINPQTTGLEGCTSYTPLSASPSRAVAGTTSLLIHTAPESISLFEVRP